MCFLVSCFCCLWCCIRCRVVFFCCWRLEGGVVLSYADLKGVPSVVQGVTPVEASQWNSYVKGNFDTLKAGHVVCTSSTRPSSLVAGDEGLMIFETDTDKFLVWDGSGWVEINDLDMPFGNPVPGCALQLNTNQSIANTTWTFLTFNSSPSYNNDNMFNSSFPDKITINTDGLYAFSATMAFYSNFVGERTFAIQQGGSVPDGGTMVAFESVYANPSPGQTAVSLSYIGPCSAGTNFYGAVFQNSGGALQLNSIYTRFSAAFLGPL